ncbi:MAG: terminase small subunit [Phycisphaerales bacterium]|nr:terminase small subunit [Phycisphaerales bacterium]
MKEMNTQEKLFVEHYVESFSAAAAARSAGYAESVATTRAWEWVSITQCPRNKEHVRKAVEDGVRERFGVDQVDSEWVLRRAKLLAEFSLYKFVKFKEGEGAVYDFSEATPDDWYCIEEYATEQISKMLEGDSIPVHKLKIKTPSKVAALKLVGDHVSVQAFKENVGHSGEVTQIVMNAEDYKKARQEALADDDC